jgi:hypothetical protein
MKAHKFFKSAYFRTAVQFKWINVSSAELTPNNLKLFRYGFVIATACAYILLPPPAILPLHDVDRVPSVDS